MSYSLGDESFICRVYAKISDIDLLPVFRYDIETKVARQAEVDCLVTEMLKSYLTRYNHDRMRR